MSRQHNTTDRFSGQKKLWHIAPLLICALAMCTQTWAADTEPESTQSKPWQVKTWKLQTSVYTKHWDSDPEHVNHQDMVDLEAVFENNYLVGGAYFKNSFGQDSLFVYFGKDWSMFQSKYWYFKLVGGLLYGYKDEYKDKIPLNGLGIAPAILPALGFRYKWAFTELQIAGTAAITVTAGIQF
ncbi:MAG TPA: hypothetical protein VI566_03090 [Xanthomonadales bacterium]|nr:hypothetical protein [Xanthomonadales bacterium]